MSSIGHHAEILRGGPEAWNAWRKKRPATIPHLSGVVLAASERELGGTGGAPINLKAALLQDAVFRFATLSAANLQAADLAHADLVHARLAHANLSDATLQGVALDHANLTGAILRHADLGGASLRFATLDGADLEGADLARADLAHARLAHANLAGANLSDAVFDYADFAGADLSQADLSGARLYNVRNLSRTQLEAALGDAATILPSHLQGCVPWSIVGDEPSVPVSDAAAFWLSQARRDLRRRTFYGQTLRVAGVVVVGAAVATGFVSETARDTLPAGPAETQSSIEPTLSMLSAMDDHAPALGMAAAMVLEEAAPPPNLAMVLADFVPPAAPAPVALIEPANVAVPSNVAEPSSETVSEIAAGAKAIRASEEMEDRLGASATKEELAPAEFSIAFSVPAVEPVTLVLASARLAHLKARQSAVAELHTRMPKIPALARAQLRLSVVKKARAVMPTLRAFDDPKSPAPAAVAVDVPEPMMLVVSLDAQKLDIYRGIKHISSAEISSGMPGYDTRTGVFSILEKKRRHHSNLYSGAPMPFMQRLTRSGTALHAGAIPGYPASHGCVRLPYSFAPKLFEMTSVGQNVVVTRGQPVPARIQHPNLFELPAPKPQVAMAASVAVPRLLTDAVAGAAESEAQTRAFRSDAPLRILVTRRTAHDRVMAVQYMLADLGYLARQNFIGNLGPATGSAIRAFQKANGLPVTGAFTDGLVSEVYRATGKIEPPEGHLFVRQGFKRVFDLPISFRDPAVSLGTHVFTVVRREGEAAKPEWMAVSLEGGEAAAALDRIDIPDDVRRSIAPRLTPGSTLIVADRSEYSAILLEGDDFLVSTAEHPKAEDAKVEQASAGPDEAAPVKAKIAKKRSVRAAPVAKPRSYDAPRSEIRRRYIGRPSFGMPYLFGR